MPIKSNSLITNSKQQKQQIPRATINNSFMILIEIKSHKYSPTLLQHSHRAPTKFPWKPARHPIYACLLAAHYTSLWYMLADRETYTRATHKSVTLARTTTWKRIGDKGKKEGGKRTLGGERRTPRGARNKRRL